MCFCASRAGGDDGSCGENAGGREGVGEGGRGAGWGRQVQGRGRMRCGGEVDIALGCLLRRRAWGVTDFSFSLAPFK